MLPSILPEASFLTLHHLVPTLLVLSSAHASLYGHNYGAQYGALGYGQAVSSLPHQSEPMSEHQASQPIIKRHFHRTHMPLVYRNQPPSLYQQQQRYPQSPHALTIDMDWRGWVPVGMSPQAKSQVMYKGEPSVYGSNDNSATSRMYFKKYPSDGAAPVADYGPNLQSEPLHNDEPIVIGAQRPPPPPPPSPSVADLYNDLQSKQRMPYRQYRVHMPSLPPPPPPLHPNPLAMMMDFQEQTYDQEDQYSDEPLYPNFDDDHNIFGYNNYFKKKK